MQNNNNKNVKTNNKKIQDLILKAKEALKYLNDLQTAFILRIEGDYFDKLAEKLAPAIVYIHIIIAKLEHVNFKTELEWLDNTKGKI